MGRQTSKLMKEVLSKLTQDNSKYTSSHWKKYESEISISQTDGAVKLQGAGFTQHSKATPISTSLMGLERLSYRKPLSYLKYYKHTWETAKRVARKLGLARTRHEWSSAIVAAYLLKYKFRTGVGSSSICLIGDGDGFLGVLLLELFPAAKIISIDLAKALVFQVETYEKYGFEDRVRFYTPSELQTIKASIDIAVNVVSMQEMNQATIATYFDFLRARVKTNNLFYCLNRARNVMPGGEVSEFLRYPWSRADTIYLHESFQFFRYFLDLHPYQNGPRMFGMRVPLINYNDGYAVHRIVKLSGGSHD